MYEGKRENISAMMLRRRTSYMKHWKMVNAVMTMACSVKKTSLAWTGFTPRGLLCSYSACKSIYAFNHMVSKQLRMKFIKARDFDINSSQTLIMKTT